MDNKTDDTIQEQENEEAFRNLIEQTEQNNWGNDRSVLIVEDSPTVRLAVVQSLKEFAPNLKVLQAKHGKDALKILMTLRLKKLLPPVFIITDLEMPEMDGWAFIEWLKDDYEKRGLKQGIPVIVLSGTKGEKGFFLTKKSVHGKRTAYQPLVTIAKSDCIAPEKYQGQGAKGLKGWISYFLKSAF